MEEKEKCMSKQMMWNLATDAVIAHLAKDGYQIEGFNFRCDVYPNVVASKDEKLYAILVDANEVRKQREYSISGTFAMLSFARTFDAIPLYASVGLCSVNPERFEKELLIDNDPDGYYVNFVGFDEISYGLIDKLNNEEERKEYLVCLLGDCYSKNDFSMLEKYLDDTCTWYSIFSGNSCNGKSEVMNHYNTMSKIIKNKKVNYYLIRYVGDWYNASASELKWADGSIDKNVMLRLPQPGGDIGLLIEQITETEEEVLTALAIGFTESGLINSIKILDPYDLNFENYYKNSL